MTTTASDDASRQSSSTDHRLRVVVVGAGVMGQNWVRLLATSPTAQLVGVVDLDPSLAASAARLAAEVAGDDGEAASGPTVVTGASVSDVALRSDAEAVIDVTVPQAHRAVNEEALRAGLPVLCEKPLAPTVAEALRQVALAEVTGQLLSVSQSRRWFRHLTAFRDAVGQLGPLAAVDARFFHADHEPGFREQMAHPLLVDMSVHHFDQLRWVAGDAPVAVRCSSWNPPWSWFAGDAAATAEFELASGARFSYAGSRCTPGLSTSWNADWHAYGEHGAARWDGDDDVALELDPRAPTAPAGAASAPPSVPVLVPVPVPDHLEGIAGSLDDFVAALRSGRTPYDEVRANVVTLAMVEGAVQSASRGGERVVLADLLDEALVTARADERCDDVAEVLHSWPDAATALAAPGWGRRSPTG